MKIFIFIFPSLIIFTSSVLPIWNIKNSSKDLLGTDNSCEYLIADRRMYELNIQLKKKITRDTEKISDQNYLDISGDKSITNKLVDYENVESFYGKSSSSGIYILCPRGNFNPININDVDNMEEIKFDEWINSDNWDLKCYYHSTGNFLMFYFMNGINQTKLRRDNEASWNNPQNLTFCDELYDFKLKNKEGSYVQEFPIMAIIKDNNLIKLYGAKLQFLSSGEVKREDEVTLNLIESKKYTQGYFNNETNHF